MVNEDTSENSPQSNKDRKTSWKTIVFVTLGVVAIGAVLIFQGDQVALGVHVATVRTVHFRINGRSTIAIAA